MGKFRHRDATENFRPEYRVRTTESQQKQFQMEQAVYQTSSQGLPKELKNHEERVDRHMQKWKETHAEREKAWEETTTARMERRDRTDPDIRYLRNKKNREEHALAKLDHAQRDYRRAAEQARGLPADWNRIQRNRLPETSNYTVPPEVQNSIGGYADFQARDARLPSRREYYRPR